MWQNDETKNRICIVTGGESGIGRQTALVLARVGCTVVLACRNLSEGEKARDEIIAETLNNAVSAKECDLASLDSIRAFVERFVAENPWLDVLLHHAAVIDPTLTRPALTEAGTEIVLTANYLGPFLLTMLLVERLKLGHSPRIINTVPAGLSMYPRLTIDFDNLNGEKGYDPSHAYYQAKLAQVMFTLELSRRLEEKGILPFYISIPRSELGEDALQRKPGLIKRLSWRKTRRTTSPTDVSGTYLWLATSRDAVPFAGTCLDEQRRPVRLPKSVQNKKARRRLWDASLKLTRLTSEVGKSSGAVLV